MTLFKLESFDKFNRKCILLNLDKKGILVKVKIYLTKKNDTKDENMSISSNLSRTTYPKLIIVLSKEQPHHFTNLQQTFVLARLSFSTVMIGLDLLQDLTR